MTQPAGSAHTHALRGSHAPSTVPTVHRQRHEAAGFMASHPKGTAPGIREDAVAGRSQSLAKNAFPTRRGNRKLLYIAKKGVEMKTGLPKAPADVDREGKKRWRELVLSVDPDDLDVLGNLCRQHSSLMALRAERAQMVAAGTFQQLVRGRESSLVLNPLTRREDKLIASTSRTLRQLGLASSFRYWARSRDCPFMWS
jgi:phage terminase small subunit